MSVDARGDDIPEIVRTAWEQHLGSPSDSPVDNFFTRGGNSLMAAELMATLSAELGTRLRLAVILRNPTLGDLTRAVSEAVARS